MEDEQLADIDEWVHKSKNKDKNKKKNEKNKGQKHMESLVKKINDEYKNNNSKLKTVQKQDSVKVESKLPVEVKSEVKPEMKPEVKVVESEQPTNE